MMVPAASTTKQPLAGQSVSVLYGGSLVQLMENQIGPAFRKASGCKYQGEGKGAFTLNLGTGALIPMEGSPYDLFSNHGSDNITVDRSGQFAFAANWNGNLIGAMRVTSTGLLTTTSGAALSGENETTIPVGNNPDSIVVAGTLQTLVPD